MTGIIAINSHSGSQSINRARVEAGRLFDAYYDNSGGFIWYLELVAVVGSD